MKHRDREGFSEVATLELRSDGRRLENVGVCVCVENLYNDPVAGGSAM